METLKLEKLGHASLATKFGISPSELQNGNVIKKKVTIKSLAEFKELFSGNLSAEQKKNHVNDLKEKHGSEFENAANGVFHRVNAHIYGDHPLSDDDKSFTERMFPLNVHTVSASDVIIDKPTIYGPSSAPVVLNYGTVTFKGNGYIAAENTILHFNAENVIIDKSTGTAPYHIGILGVKGSAGRNGDNGTSYPNQAASGSDSKPSTPGICDKGSGGDGTTGKNGGDGQNGVVGGDGKPSLQANIFITTKITGNLAVFTQSGEGGNGGNGGNGGLGQQGGNGGKGCDSGCEGTNGGDGKNGGNGGNGGDGGNGGNGIQGNNVYVKTPSGQTGQITHFSQIASPGNGGVGGKLGQPGTGGSYGKGGKHHSNGQKGSSGNPGKPGKEGTSGTVSGQPGTIYVS